MVQRFRLLATLVTALALVLVLSLTPINAAFASDCSTSDWLSGTCTSVGNDGTEVTIEGEVTKPGTIRDIFDQWPVGTTPPPEPAGPVVARDNYTAVMPVTLADVAKFRPNPGIDLMQPNGWMIVGLSTNFYAQATQHIKTGTLLNAPASVRFTPVRYYWTYGDGSSRTSSTPGATWAAHGIHEFDATPTSHIYRSPGRYLIDLTIGYAPEYRLDSGTEWIPVRGLVWVPANRLVAVASAGAKTVLVEDECTINPVGPGC